MNPKNSALRRKIPGPIWLRRGCAVWVAVLAGWCLPLCGQESPASLEENSPFLPPNFGKKNEPEPEQQEAPQGPLSQRVEFRSVIRIENSWLFSLYDSEEKKSLWLELDQPGATFQVTGFNEENKRLQLAMGGRSEWIQLKVSDASAPPTQVTSGGSAAQRPTSTPQVTGRTSSGRVKLNRRTVPRRRVVVPTRRNTTPAEQEN